MEGKIKIQYIDKPALKSKADEFRNKYWDGKLPVNIESIIERIDIEFQNELIRQTQIKGTSLSFEETSAVVSKYYPQAPSYSKILVQEIIKSVQPTLNRVQRGESYPWKNDGGIYKNLTDSPGRPEIKSDPEYYREYVHPTVGLSDGDPGLQRIVIGKGGETYYAPNHYDNFIKLK